MLQARSADNTLCIIEHFGNARCRAAAAGAVLKPLGGNCAVFAFYYNHFCPFCLCCGPGGKKPTANLAETVRNIYNEL